MANAHGDVPNGTTYEYDSHGELIDDELQQAGRRLTQKQRKKREVYAGFLSRFPGQFKAAAEMADFDNPVHMGQKLRSDPYVLELMRRKALGQPCGKIWTKSEMMLDAKTNAHNPDISDAARAKYYDVAIKLHAMEALEEGTIGASGGVMIVPDVDNADDWEQLAANAQKQLKNDVRQ